MTPKDSSPWGCSHSRVLAGTDAEQGVEGAGAEQACQERDDADPAPRGLRTDEYDSDQGDAQQDAGDAIGGADVVHGGDWGDVLRIGGGEPGLTTSSLEARVLLEVPESSEMGTPRRPRGAEDRDGSPSPPCARDRIRVRARSREPRSYNPAMPSRPLIGIDLGTTHSLCALFEGGQPKLIPNAHGQVLTPSVVARLDSGELVVGQAALDWQVLHPESAVSQFKRWMGEDRQVPLGPQTFSPAELSSLVLRALRQDAEAYLGEPVEQAVITVPAYFNEHQRLATRTAGELAGLTVRRIVNEPTAAALSYGFHRAQSVENLLIFDLGGGTFDVTVMEIFEGTLEIRSTAGESHLGGEDFTDRLLHWALQQSGQQLEHAQMATPKLVARLREEAEQAKRALSAGQTARLRLPEAEGQVPPGAPELTLDHAQFASLAEPLTARLQRPTERALRDAQMTWKDIDDVILVGGATRMPLIPHLLADWSGRPPQDKVDPDQVVALGAAVQAALIQDDRAVEDMVMTDVCPFTLGVQISKVFGGRHVSGYFLPVIHRNTTIPVSRQESVATLQANQTEVSLEVYQGESRKVEENLKLGELKVTGIPPGPAGQEVLVRFTYDLSGLLEVEAIVPATEERFETLLTHNVAGLSQEEIRLAQKKMQAVKFYPRDDLENRRLLHFASKLVGEIAPSQRSALEEVIDHFEASMESQDPKLFEHARQQLLLALSALGYAAPESDSENPDG